jgi:chromosome segregation ATPase
MTSGQAILGRLRKAQEDARADAARLARDALNAERRLKDVLAEKGTAVLELAKHYLPEISRDRVDATFTEVRGDLATVVDRKERARAELAGRRDRFDESCLSLQEQLDAVSRQLEEATRQVADAETDIAHKLADNTEFQQLSQQALAAEHELKQNEERAEQIQREAEAKLPAYRESRLFQYLYQRGFATPTYQSRGLVRGMDRWVANLIDFRRAKQSYEFLQKTPELVNREITRRREEFESLMNRVEAIERRVRAESPLADLERRASSLTKDRERLEKSLAREHQQRESLDADLQKLDSDGRFYDEALGRFRTFLGDTETAVLQQRAALSPELIDDEIVSRIAWQNQQIDSLRAQVDELQTRTKQAKAQSDGLSHVVRRFRQMELDGPTSQFETDLDLDGTLERYRNGVLSRDELLETIRDRRVGRAGGVEAPDDYVPSTGRVLLQALGEIAGAALEGGVRRSVGRRRYE